ncbi:hypothetical protein BGHDH14_bgh01706 [Blumeria hordei DH14]|uniref:Urease accessory protein UreD n=1 Tax=Blumeria graminis f. sp. hordei (strain DH14) TaxID=546991 RepID=N1JB88_BLUG1|nr:hypothetical protein BGHDH14_bgh01706 [Blumeria hordei DH14]
MPHKHKRREEVDKSLTDLPPTLFADPLPAYNPTRGKATTTSAVDKSRKTGKKRKRNHNNQDDTPKLFVSLLEFQKGKKLPLGLDDGSRTKKTAKASSQGKAKPDCKVTTSSEVPVIRSGEKLSEFSARVDAALPVSGLINNSAKRANDPLGLKTKRTRMEKRMHKMYDEWRVEEAKRKEMRQEAAELIEEKESSVNGQMNMKSYVSTSATSAKVKKTKRKKLQRDASDSDEDPWAQIKRDRGEKKPGLHDLVQAPPAISIIPKEKFQARVTSSNVENVPRGSGSLRRRELLGEMRRNVLEGYRSSLVS